MQEEKRRRFQVALHKIYFPPPPPPPAPPPSPPPVDFSDLGPLGEADDYVERDDEEVSSSETGDPRKLTRSQRKRLRKKKLKEASAAAASAALPGQRRKIIGPMLPPQESAPRSEHLQGNGYDRPSATVKE
uniref:Uncharacterized protein n=1 Tax=Anthurium amnicola TaxID=1678845 RepID=A0A1D1XDI0_9ARAE